jgi:hypothetical protein
MNADADDVEWITIPGYFFFFGGGGGLSQSVVLPGVFLAALAVLFFLIPDTRGPTFLPPCEPVDPFLLPAISI